jgi:hypothetical protein
MPTGPSQKYCTVAGRSLGVVVNGSHNRLNPIPVRALAAGQAGASYLVRL